jgi:Transposase Tn5 dimerisation domain
VGFKKQDKLTIFFSNPKILSEQLIRPHYKQTVQRIQDSDAEYILAIQDQMRLNFTKHKAKSDLGSIGKSGKTIQYGLIQHSILSVTDQNEPLGLLDVSYFDYDDIDTSTSRSKRAIEDKANKFWIDALKKMRERLGDTQKKIITVADREGDFYEFLHRLITENEEFVIRSQHNRILGELYQKKGEKLRETLDRSAILGSMKVEIQDVNSREIKEITLSLKATQVTLPIPKKMPEDSIKEHDYTPITLNVVQAYNDEHEWILLTQLRIDTLDQIKKIVIIYKARWHIEDYHKVLKTGYQVDEIYLHTSKEAIKKLLILSSISACRLYWLIYIGRTEVSIKADQLFEEFEWKAIYVYFNEAIPNECPTVSEVMLKIARLGGYKDNKWTNPPGIKTIWIGYQQFTVAAQMYRNMSRKT